MARLYMCCKCVCMCVCEYLAGGAVHVLCVTRLWLEMETSECRAEPLEKLMAACRKRVNEGMNAGMTEPNNKPKEPVILQTGLTD